ncbi:glycoside hydrolase family 3 N-terminal domain-containing protein [Escherichia coli]
MFPISLGLASSFNLDAVKTVGRVSAYKAADDGLNNLGTDGEYRRDPRWGRASEGFGEDTYLTSTMGKTMVEAMQGKSPRWLLGDDQRQTLCRIRRGRRR